MKSDPDNSPSDSESAKLVSGSSALNRVRSNSAGSLPLPSSWKHSQQLNTKEPSFKPCLVSREIVVNANIPVSINDPVEIEESTSIASTAVSNAMNIVQKDRLTTEAATNLALEKVDLGGTALPQGVLRAAGVQMRDIAPPQLPPNYGSTRRRSSQTSIKRTSHSRSPPPSAFYENFRGQNVDFSPSLSDLGDTDPLINYNQTTTNRESSPLPSNFQSASDLISQSKLNSSAPLAEAVVNAICIQHGVNSKLIRRSTSAATSYMASDEDNSQEDDPTADDLHAGSNRRRTKKLSSNLRKRSSIRQNNPDNPDDNSTNLESGYGASNFSITSSGRSSVGAHSINNKSCSSSTSNCKSSNGTDDSSKQHRHPNHRTVRIVDRKDSDEDEDGQLLHKSSAFEPVIVSRSSPSKLTAKHASSSSYSTEFRAQVPQKQGPSDEDERFSLEDMLSGPQNPSSSHSNPQKHVTLDVRFADFADSDASLPPNTDRQSLSARNSTTGSECMCFIQAARASRNHSLCGELNPCAYKSASAGHSVDMTPSRNASFENGFLRPGMECEEGLISSDICCHYCYSMRQGNLAFANISREAASEPNGESGSSDEHLKKSAQGAISSFNDRRCSSGTQSLSEPQYVVNLVSSERRPCEGALDSNRLSDEFTGNFGHTSESKRPIKWKHRSKSSLHHRACNLHRNFPTNSSRLNGEKRTVNFLVDGVRFQVDARMLEAQPDTMLGRMFCSTFAENLNPNSDIQLGMHSPDLSPTVFRTILDFYLRGKMTCPPDLDIHSLKEACDYFLIPFNYHTVRCNNIRAFLHELSDDGAYRAFEGFFDMHILPKLVECTRSGERECHLVVLMDDETISWDEDYPPQMPDNELSAHLVFSTQMYRFLKYNENREVAKKFLSSKYLKKIRIGIEGYPTYKERVKYRGHRPEVIYNYAQRPFIHMSWEHEENKSRHVDFQCVKSKSASDLTSLEQVLGVEDPDLTAPDAAPPVEAAGLLQSTSADVLDNEPSPPIDTDPPADQAPESTEQSLPVDDT